MENNKETMIKIQSIEFHTCDKCRYKGYGFKNGIEIKELKHTIGTRVFNHFIECPKCGYKEFD